jgi:hypothetical protein
LNTSKRYWSVAGSANFIVEAVAVSVGELVTTSSLTGDTGTGGVAFNVEPSGAAGSPPASLGALEPVGAVSVDDWRLHAAATTNRTVTQAASDLDLDIHSSY